MTLADRLDALLTRPIYECDLETIREAAKRLRALVAEKSGGEDVLERLREIQEQWPAGGLIHLWDVSDTIEEIERLRSERSELIEALEALLEGHKVQHTSPWVLEKASSAARSILSKIKEQKA